MDSRRSSGVIFAGFESFEEVRHGFEFNNNQPAFYPPSGATRRDTHGWQDSLFSIASVSSYGRVTNPGSTDTFDYGLPSLRERPSAEDVFLAFRKKVFGTSRRRLPAGVHGAQTSALRRRIVDADESDEIAWGCDFE